MGEDFPRWRIGLQADPLTIHTWSIWCGLSMLRSSGTIELHHLARDLPAERSVWIEAHDRQSDRVRTVCIDINDFGSYSTPVRNGLADSTWKRGYESGPALSARTGRADALRGGAAGPLPGRGAGCGWSHGAAEPSSAHRLGSVASPGASAVLGLRVWSWWGRAGALPGACVGAGNGAVAPRSTCCERVTGRGHPGSGRCARRAFRRWVLANAVRAGDLPRPDLRPADRPGLVSGPCAPAPSRFRPSACTDRTPGNWSSTSPPRGPS